ncbi:MAG: T9SS type A sorting domain-containing protein [Bacteroidetes bacterium]|nr:T9SS type A sorting domain-containing protein [Bacteroidota bacterium]
MKWITVALFSIICYNAKSQTNIWAGGSYDGAASAYYNNSSEFSVWNGGTADGAASAEYTNPTNFNIWKGGQGDGFAWASNTRVCSNPIVVTNTTVTNITQTTATFSWTTFNYGSSYTILIRRDSCNSIAFAGGSPSGPCAVGLNSIVISGLIPGAYYCLTLQEHCDAGSSTAESSGSAFTTVPTDCNPPTVLQNLGNTGSSTRIGWTPGYSNTSFQIMLIKQGTTDTFWHSGPITGSPMRDTIKCLPTGSFFNYYIRENCGYSASGHSQWINGYTTYTSPGCAAPSNQTASVINTQNANLSWIDNTYNATPYQISYGVGISNAAQGTKTAVTIPTLISGNTITHALFVSGGVGNITWFVREVCSQCDTTVWTGPNTLGSAKNDETGNITGIPTSAPDDLELQLFPNPNNGSELNVKAMNLSADAELMIYNLQGEIVARQLLKPDDITTLNVSHLADAVYLCRVTSPQISRTIRLVIQR